MANDKKVNKKEKKHFLKDFKTELKKVTWPTGKQLVNNTIAVVSIVLITALIVFILDLCFEGLNKYGINKLKSAVNNNTSTVIDENTPSPETTPSESGENQSTTDGQGETPNGEEVPSPQAEE